jgi:hypothetical protein
MINVASTAQALSDTYASMGAWIGLATADPGGTSTPNQNAEVAVGAGPAPGYARQQTIWTSESGGVNRGSAVTFSVPPGLYTFMILCSDANGNTMIDNCPISATVNSNGNGQLVVVPEYTQI